MYLIRSGAIEGFWALISSLGENPHPLLEWAGISAAQLRQPDALVSYTRLADLLDYSAGICREPLLGLRLAATQNPLVIGELALSSGQQATLEESLHYSNQHLHLHAHGVHIAHHKTGERVQIHLQFDFSNSEGLCQLRQMSCGHLYITTEAMLDRRNAGSPDRQLHMHLRQAQPHSSWQPEKRFGSIHYDAEFDGISLPAQWLGRRPNADTISLRHHFEQRVELLEQRYPDNLQAQISYIIGNLLGSGECSLERVANALNMHPRVLQKRLARQQLTFRNILRESRQRLAEQHLRYSHISVTELALQLGYAEVAVFSRNFRQWTGQSPRQWRLQYQKGAAAPSPE
ncbi:AraC family transcriptional regulator [Pseudomaricurvus alkylphenolicus]|jgi:AraC-like DNA-binding protein|uniref:helix-turn-helix transcriptional regulator n=1 Tax=Pseudomaricurvus alkylphenolicus TaxID=1306991 RepID=UPI001423F0EC|nr:AraC family transcriptional regulator [Pseudomaricurvus alkylphenolicus]NIB39958.1 AraC family transcriptional regulator [Pseudomaricurvus alkylphenolicus]